MHTLGVSRSNLYRRLKQPDAASRLRYCKTDDMALLPIIREICDQRPSNGYRRVTAHLNRYLKQHVMKLARGNPKRIYRIMKQNQLLLTRAEPLRMIGRMMGKLQYLFQTAAGVQMALRSSAGMARKYG